VGRQRLHGDVLTDGLGNPRVVHRTPDWRTSCIWRAPRIRANGADNMQVARRLRALLDNLIASLPRHRHQVLIDERARLDQANRDPVPAARDLALARIWRQRKDSAVT
jgi:hypothetical protein